MAAYVLAQIRVTDPANYPKYMALAAPAVAKYGGKYLTRGGKTEVLEGAAPPLRLVILEFPSMDAAHTFYNSPEYREAREARKHTAEFVLTVLEGYQP